MIHYPNGVWPMMLTPYRMDDMVDHEGLAALTHWYMANGVAGLFAACQPSEIFRLSPQECAALMVTTVKAAGGRMPVVDSGHVSTRRCLKRSSLRLFSTNTATLLETLLQGAAGFSGVMANFPPRLYAWLCRRPEHPGANKIQGCLSLASMAARSAYLVCARYYLRKWEASPIASISRLVSEKQLTGVNWKRIQQMTRICVDTWNTCVKEGGRP